MKFEFEIDHIGIAVPDLAQASKFYKILGFDKMEIEEVPSELVRTGFLELSNQASLELLEPTTEDSVIKKFLEKRGPGIHHICLRVKNIDDIVANLKKQGIRLINESPKLGAHNCRVIFIHPASTGGVLIELSEPQTNV